jgi:uncharacterized protein
MVAKLFIDTWGWLTLHDAGERQHLEARQVYQQAIVQKAWIYTTDYVLDETFTLFFKRLPASRANQSMQALLSIFNTPNFHLIHISPERFAQTQALRSKLLDHPQVSFTDLSSMIVMKEFSILEVLTEDAHFTHVGMGFQRTPTR